MSEIIIYMYYERIKHSCTLAFEVTPGGRTISLATDVVYLLLRLLTLSEQTDAFNLNYSR